MKALISTLVDKADLSSDQAEKVASVVKSFLAEKLPDAIQGPVVSAINGGSVEDAAGKAKDLLGKLF